MKSSVKTTLTELLAAVVLVVAVAIILSMGLSSCASTEKPVEPAQTAETEKKSETKKKTEYSKTDFMEDLKSVLNKDGPEAALSLYETKLPAKYADDFDLLFLKAAINVSAENLDEAQALCNELSQRDPQNDDVASLAVAIAKMKGDNAERIKQVNSLLAKDKLNSAANVELGEDMFLKKNYKQAKIYYKRALVREPENIDALRGAGQCDYYLEMMTRRKKLSKRFSRLTRKTPRLFCI